MRSFAKRNSQAYLPRRPVFCPIRFGLWDAASAKELGQFRGSDGGFHALAFTPAGKFLVSGSADTTVLLWDVAMAGKLPKPAKPNVILIGD